MSPPKEAAGIAGKARPARKLKDQAAPKRPVTAFLAFSMAERAKVQEELGTRDFKEVGRELGKRWARLDAAAKGPYELEGRMNKERFEEEMKNYKPSKEFLEEKAKLEGKDLTPPAKKPKLGHPLAMKIRKSIDIKQQSSDKKDCELTEDVSSKKSMQTSQDVLKTEFTSKEKGAVIKEEAMDYGQVQVEVGRRWEEEVGRSPEVEQARRDVELQGEEILRRKEQLRSARARGQELEARSRHVELALKPPALVFMEKVEAGEDVEEQLVQQVGAAEWRVMATVLGEVVEKRQDRAGLVRVVDTLLKVRKVLQVEEAVGVLGELAMRVVRHLGREDIEWAGMEDWEMEVVRQLVAEIRKVPTFLKRMVDQLLVKVVKVEGVEDREVLESKEGVDSA